LVASVGNRVGNVDYSRQWWQHWAMVATLCNGGYIEHLRAKVGLRLQGKQGCKRRKVEGSDGVG